MYLKCKNYQESGTNKLLFERFFDVSFKFILKDETPYVKIYLKKYIGCNLSFSMF